MRSRDREGVVVREAGDLRLVVRDLRLLVREASLASHEVRVRDPGRVDHEVGVPQKSSVLPTRYLARGPDAAAESRSRPGNFMFREMLCVRPQNGHDKRRLRIDQKLNADVAQAGSHQQKQETAAQSSWATGSENKTPGICTSRVGCSGGVA